MEHRRLRATGADVGGTRVSPAWVAGIAEPDVPVSTSAPRRVIHRPGVPTVSPGARDAGRVRGDVAAAAPTPPTDSRLADLPRGYGGRIRAHDRW